MQARPTEFSSEEAYLAALPTRLPRGFRVGTHSLAFAPQEVPTMRAKMTVTTIVLDEPTDRFAALFTRNAFPGAPVLVGRARVARAGSRLQAVVVNNKVSNVCAPGGVEAAEEVCAAAASALGLASPDLVLPSSTGVIGWRLPVAAMTAALPGAAAALQRESILPAARGICTTDLYPKVRAATVPHSGGGTIVGIAKGAGMVEPNLATMLVYLLTDVAVPRDLLRAMLPRACSGTFNAISVDSDTSTSDTVLAVSSGALSPLAPEHFAGFEAALTTVCAQLAEDVVRNGEGVAHVMRVRVRGAKTNALARAVGKSIINSPLFKCAVNGNDPNVGRLVAAIGKCVGSHADGATVAASVAQTTTIRMGGLEIYSRGQFRLSGEVERALVAHLRAAQLWQSRPQVAAGAAPVPGSNAPGVPYALRAEDVSFVTPVSFPPHERCVEIEVDLGAGAAEAKVIGSDLTHEYVHENADYRS
jgi:glutamate N-acetyltransferase/amino-acid N-acetyltransferase